MITLSRREALTGICCLAGTALLSGCAVNPVTGKREFMLMSESKEISMGKQAHADIVKSYGSFSDDTIQGWFNERGQEMGKVTHRSHLNYTFTVLDTPVVNAFAVPGGYVYVTRGILGYFNNEAQFAGVLAHEFGHVNYRHTAARYSKAKLANLSLVIGSIFSEEFSKYAQLASMGVSMLFLKFSRDDEREADKAGVDYSSKVGYNAVEMSEFFHTLERMHPKGGSLPTWSSTHPDPGDRVKATLNMSRKFQSDHPDREYVTKRNEYLELIDGMIFGEDPNQGYVRDNAFIHPGMKFMFPVPSGWKLTNSPAEVRMAPEDQNAVLIFTFSQGATPRDASVQFAKENNVNIINTQILSINGMSVFKTTGSMKSDNSEITITSYFIDKEGSVFAFHGLSAPANADTYGEKFDNTANGFKEVTDNALLEVSPETIQLRTAKAGKTLTENFNDFGVPEKEHEELAVLNGMELSHVIDAGTRIKIVA